MKNKGITLIALVITIIVMLILVVVTINVATDGGLIKKSHMAKDQTQRASDWEELEIAISAAKNYDTGVLSSEALKSELGSGWDITSNENEYICTSPNKNTFKLTLKGVLIDDSTPKDLIPKDEEIIKEQISEKGYVGYYADIDGNPETVEGIIYADLAVSVTGTTWENFSYTAENNLKDYYISNPSYNGIFGTKPVLSATGTGNDRFYIMALEEYNNGTLYYWNYNLYSSLSLPTEFGSGKNNTKQLIAKWNENAENKNTGKTYTDLWGIFKDTNNPEGTLDPNVWFMPSSGEFSAFLENLGIKKNNYSNLELPNTFFTSSNSNHQPLIFMFLINDFSTYSAVYYNDITISIRLTATF